MIEWTAPIRRPLLRQPVALTALAWLALVGLGASLAPLLAPAGPLEADPGSSLLPPGAGSALGTDFLGRDVLARLLWGGRWTLEMDCDEWQRPRRIGALDAKIRILPEPAKEVKERLIGVARHVTLVNTLVRPPEIAIQFAEAEEAG